MADKIGRATKQLLVGVSLPHALTSERTFSPQGPLCKMERYQGFLPGESGVGGNPAFDVLATRSHQAGAAAGAPERPVDDERDNRGSVEEATGVATGAQAAESPEGTAESTADPTEGLAVGENKTDDTDADAEAAENGVSASVADAFEPEEADIAGPEVPAADTTEVGGEAAVEVGAIVSFKGNEDFSTVSEGTRSDSKGVILTDSTAESDVPAKATDVRDRPSVTARFSDIDVVGGESDLEARGELDPTRDDASNLGGDCSGASKRENQEETL